jgi:hypothetical protein
MGSYLTSRFVILEAIAMDEIRKKLEDNATLPIWPDVAQLFGLCRGSAYAAAQRGDIKTIKIGRLLKVPTAWLRQKLDLKD